MVPDPVDSCCHSHDDVVVEELDLLQNHRKPKRTTELPSGGLPWYHPHTMRHQTFHRASEIVLVCALLLPSAASAQPTQASRADRSRNRVSAVPAATQVSATSTADATSQSTTALRSPSRTKSCADKRRNAANADGTSDIFPAYVLDDIQVQGNRVTKKAVILRYVPFQKGDVIRASDPRVIDTKYRLLGLGFFHSVHLDLKRGERHGHAILVLRVRERGTILINNIFLGTSEATRFWGGIDAADTNFLGRGMLLSAAFVAGTKALVPGAHIQHAERLRFSDPSVLGSRFAIHAMLLHADASEFFRTSGHSSWSSPKYFTTMRYRRIGGMIGTGVNVGAFNRVAVFYRLEHIYANMPSTTVRTYPDNSTWGIDFGLGPGSSFLSSLVVDFLRDRRGNPVLPHSGYRIRATGELSAQVLASSYTFAKLVGQYQQWWKLPRANHSISLEIMGGLIVGNAPLFNRFFIGDVNDLLPSRALELNFSTMPSRNLLHTIMDDKRYENMTSRIAIEYSLDLFRGHRFLYGVDFFARVGVFSLLSKKILRQRQSDFGKALPLDLTMDVGVRLDTRVGVFTLSVANALGRLPW